MCKECKDETCGSAANGGMLETLSKDYGWKLLGMLAFSQWIIKGLVWGYSVTAMDFLFQGYGVPGPKMQVYRAVVMLPWAMKPLFGLLSDAFPINGYRKIPYLLAVTLAAVLSHTWIGMFAYSGLQLKGAVLCLVCGCLQVSIVDLLTEARYAEKIREKSSNGPNIISYIWGGITFGNLVANASVGFVLEAFGPRAVYSMIAVPAGTVLVPTWLNWLGEERINEDDQAAFQEKLRKHKELIFLALLSGGGAVVLLVVGLSQESVWVSMTVALTISVVIIGSFLLVLKPLISHMTCFFFVQTCCAVDISGGSFYFFTDDAKEFPNGPHFSKLFFASGLGVCVAGLNLLGMWVYYKYMQEWRYHGLLIFANLLLCVIHIASLLVYTRWNLKLGMPDEFFVLGTWGVLGIVNMWMWLPGVILLAHMCPKGVEATMYALLAGCHNLGLSVASYLGAGLLEVLGVHPRGEASEEATFDNLWIAGLVQAVLPVVTLVLLPWMIPNAKQTETLLDENASAVDGSPWSRIFPKKSRDDPVDEFLLADTRTYGAT